MKLSVIKKIGSGFTALILALSFLTAPVNLHFEAKKADALFGVGDIVLDPSNLIQTTLTAGFNKLVAAATDLLTNKDLILDGIAWQIINLTLQSMSKDIVSWINSGFDGSPAFVRDLGGFMTNVADKVAGEYIWGRELAFLCSPFKLNIQMALDIQYRSGRDSTSSKCTLSGVADNIEGFFNGDFLSGGWDSWYSITNTPANNPYGAMLEAQGALTIKISGAQNAELKLLDFGKGLFSKKQQVCSGRDDRAKCVDKIVTPGETINSQLNTALNIPAGRLQVADEINEIVGALFTQLATKALAGAGGLLSLSDSSSSQTGDPNSSFFTDMSNDPTNSPAPVGTAQNPIEKALADEAGYQTMLQEVVNMILSAEAYKDDMYGPTNGCHSGELSLELQDALDTYSAEIIAGGENVTLLNQLLTDYTTAQGDPNKQLAIMQVFLDIQTTGELHTEMSTKEMELEIVPAIEDMVTRYYSEVDQACMIQSTGGA